MLNTTDDTARVIEKLTNLLWEKDFNRYKSLYTARTTIEDAFRFGFAAGAAQLATRIKINIKITDNDE